MGCDIHAFTEVKVDDRWHHYGPLKIDRQYALFGRMAGVRGEDPIAPLRGWPEDATFMSKLHERDWHYDAHSHSWLNLEEIITLEKEFHVPGDWGKPFGFMFGNYWESFLDRGQPLGIQDARMLFFFDC